MNLFQKYGIKEVADVVIYSVNAIGDEEFYTPVLFLDTLKVSTLEKVAEKVSATGGKGNKKLITWNYGKEITLNLEDALFSPASMSMIWGGTLDAKLSDYTSAIVKCNLANKYGRLHYSTKAYPSPALTDSEWELVFSAAEACGIDSGADNDDSTKYINKEDEYVAENRTALIKKYFKRRESIVDDGEYNGGMNPEIIKKIMDEINTLDKLGYIKTDFHDLEVIDRMENCIVKDRNGLTINAAKQRENLFKYYSDDRTCSYTIFYDAKTMLPLMPITNGYFGVPQEEQTYYWALNALSYENSEIPLSVRNKLPERETNETMAAYITRLNSLDIRVADLWNSFYIFKEAVKNQIKTLPSGNTVVDVEILSIYSANENQVLFKLDSHNQVGIEFGYFNVKYRNIIESDLFKLKIGTKYYKWTRTVKYKEDEDDGILGKTLVIDADTFPENYRIVGETYIREQKTQKDQRYQFTIFRANVSSDTNITLEAEGDPTTFSMSIDVLVPPNDIMMELKQIDVEEDKYEGGTRIVPQKSKYTYTPTNIDMVQEVNVDNSEMY